MCCALERGEEQHGDSEPDRGGGPRLQQYTARGEAQSEGRQLVAERSQVVERLGAQDRRQGLPFERR